MKQLVELTESSLSMMEQNQQVIFNLLVLVALIGVIGHFLSPRNPHEKNEALKQVILFGGMLMILKFAITVVASLGQMANSNQSSLATVFGLCIVGYWWLYSVQVKAKKDGKPVFYTKAYRQLEEVEAWLDDKGQQGFSLDSSSPDYFGFNFIQTNQTYHYKTAYYPSSKLKDRQAFIDANERDGWEFVRAGLSDSYANQPKKTIGLSSIAIFKTTDLALSKDTTARFNYRHVTRKIGSTLIINFFVFIASIGATWYFSEVKLLLNATVLIGFAVFVQLMIYLYSRYGIQSNVPASPSSRSLE